MSANFQYFCNNGTDNVVNAENEVVVPPYNQYVA